MDTNFTDIGFNYGEGFSKFLEFNKDGLYKNITVAEYMKLRDCIFVYVNFFF